MSIEQVAWVLNHSPTSGSDKLMLVCIANHDGDGGAWPSIDTLVGYTNTDRRSVQRTISRLVEKGHLIVHANAGGVAGSDPRYRSNRYEIVKNPGAALTSPLEDSGALR